MRRRAGAERHGVDLAALRIQNAEMTAALRGEIHRPARRGIRPHVVREEPARNRILLDRDLRMRGQRDCKESGGEETHVQPPRPALMRSMPACAHTASFSPPGAPDTPMAPTISLP